VIHTIKNAISEQEPRLLRSCEIFKANGKASDTSGWRAIGFLEENKFIKKVRAGENFYYILTPKGEDLVFTEDKTRAFGGLIEMLYGIMDKEG
jgi:hypothetical protein